MIRPTIIAGLLFVASLCAAIAQGVSGQQCCVPTPPANDSSSRIANTAFVQNAISTNGAAVVATISALRLKQPVVGAGTATLGYYAVGDGGSNLYYGAQSTPGTYVDNGITIIVPTGGDGSLAWLTATQQLNLLQAGAHCDGSTNDATVFNSLLALTNYALVPPKTCAITSTIFIPQNGYVTGYGKQSVVLISGAMEFNGFTICNYSSGCTGASIGTAPTAPSNVTLSNIRISSTVPCSVNCALLPSAVTVAGVNYAVIHDLWIDGASFSAVQLSNSSNNTVESIHSTAFLSNYTNGINSSADIAILYASSNNHICHNDLFGGGTLGGTVGNSWSGVMVHQYSQSSPVPKNNYICDNQIGYHSAYGVESYSFGVIVNAGSFVVGKTYTINTVGTTNWVAIGAASNTAGLKFIATGVGSGTGNAGITYNDMNTTIVDNNFAGTDGAVLGGTAGACIYIQNSGGSIISHNMITGCAQNTTTIGLAPGGVGINNNNGTKIIVSNNEINMNWSYFGIYVVSSLGGALVSNNNIYASNIPNTSVAAAIKALDSSNVSIISNDLDLNSFAIPATYIIGDNNALTMVANLSNINISHLNIKGASTSYCIIVDMSTTTGPFTINGFTIDDLNCDNGAATAAYIDGVNGGKFVNSHVTCSSNASSCVIMANGTSTDTDFVYKGNFFYNSNAYYALAIGSTQTRVSADASNTLRSSSGPAYNLSGTGGSVAFPPLGEFTVATLPTAVWYPVDTTFATVIDCNACTSGSAPVGGGTQIRNVVQRNGSWTVAY